MYNAYSSAASLARLGFRIMVFFYLKLQDDSTSSILLFILPLLPSPGVLLVEIIIALKNNFTAHVFFFCFYGTRVIMRVQLCPIFKKKHYYYPKQHKRCLIPIVVFNLITFRTKENRQKVQYKGSKFN